MYQDNFTLEDTLENLKREIHTSLPGIVQKYYGSSKEIDVVPAVKSLRYDGTEVILPELLKVKLQVLGSGEFFIDSPLKEGDNVLLFFSEACIDGWSKDGGVQSPDDERRFSLSDAFAIPCVFPDTTSFSGTDDSALTLRKFDGSAYIKVTSSGNVEINGNFDNAVNFSPLNTIMATFIVNYNMLVTSYLEHLSIMAPTAHGALSSSPVTPPPVLMTTLNINAAKNSKVKL